MILLLAFSFLAGFVTILAPCIWPVLPIVLSSSIAGSKGHKRPLGITLGVMLSFTLFTLSLSYLVRIFHLDPNILRIFAVIPLTAAALDIVKTTNSHIWVLLALTIGNGGSLLVIGSSPGIIAMAMIKDFTFNRYFRIAVFPVLIAVCAGILVWYAQFLIFP